jgi:hypothetical protein
VCRHCHDMFETVAYYLVALALRVCSSAIPFLALVHYLLHYLLPHCCYVCRCSPCLSTAAYYKGALLLHTRVCGVVAPSFTLPHALLEHTCVACLLQGCSSFLSTCAYFTYRLVCCMQGMLQQSLLCTVAGQLQTHCCCIYATSLEPFLS